MTQKAFNKNNLWLLGVHQNKKLLLFQWCYQENKKIGTRYLQNIHLKKGLVFRKLYKEFLKFNNMKTIRFLKWASDGNKHLSNQDVQKAVNPEKCLPPLISQGKPS